MEGLAQIFKLVRYSENMCEITKGLDPSEQCAEEAPGAIYSATQAGRRIEGRLETFRPRSQFEAEIIYIPQGDKFPLSSAIPGTRWDRLVKCGNNNLACQCIG